MSTMKVIRPEIKETTIEELKKILNIPIPNDASVDWMMNVLFEKLKGKKI